MYYQTYSDGQNVYSVYMMHKYVNDNKDKLKIQEIATAKFDYMREWKIWGNWGNPQNRERWSIDNVLKNPDKYQKDYKNIIKADLKFPIITVYTPLDTYYILDGNHRLGKSILGKKKIMKAYVFTDPNLLKKFKLGKESKTLREKIEKLKKKDFDSLYDERF
jgi:hypothetical protein